jgi:predicted nucleotidyltransferase
MITEQDIRRRREAILEVARRHGAHDVRIFGSVARGEAAEGSDLDLIVRFEPHRSLLDHAGLIGDLEDLLGVKVDVIDADGMRPRFRTVVEKEAVPL